MSERKTVFITGASRGIGHATATYFVQRGWRAITCSRDEVPPECPRDERHEHITVDLELTDAAAGHGRAAAQHPGRPAAARAGQQCRLLAQGRGRQAAGLPRQRHGGLGADLRDQLLRAGLFQPRLRAAAGRDRRLDRQHHLDRRPPRPPLRRQRLQHLQGGADRRSPASSRPTSPIWASAPTPSAPARSTPPSSRPAPRRSSSASRSSAWARPRRSRPRSSTCAARRPPTSPVRRSRSTAARTSIDGTATPRDNGATQAITSPSSGIWRG